MFFFCEEQKYCICQLLSATQYIVFLQLDDRIFCFLCQAKDKMDENRGCKHGKRGKTKECLSPYVFMEEFCYIIISKESLDGASPECVVLAFVYDYAKVACVAPYLFCVVNRVYYFLRNTHGNESSRCKSRHYDRPCICCRFVQARG